MNQFSELGIFCGECGISDDAGIDALCNSGKITLDTIEEWGNEHLKEKNSPNP